MANNAHLPILPTICYPYISFRAVKVLRMTVSLVPVAHKRSLIG